MNSVIIGVSLMLFLSFVRVNVILAMILSAVVTGLFAGLGLEKTIEAFNTGLSGGAETALSYAVLGAFAVTLSKSGLTQILAEYLLSKLKGSQSASEQSILSYVILLIIIMCSIFSQNLVPVHIAFIPMLIPPLLVLMNQLQLDRRLVACVITFGLATSYMVLPFGFGRIYLINILHKNLIENGLNIAAPEVTISMIIPALGMLIGLIIAFFSYRKKRKYTQTKLSKNDLQVVKNKSKVLMVGCVAIIGALLAQNYTNSMIFGGLVGIVLFNLFGLVKWKNNSDLFSQGVLMMAMIGFIMISAQGFASVIKATGDISSLVASTSDLVVGNRALAAALILTVGLFITMGIGSSFSTVPIIATLFVPLCIQLGFTEMATVALVGTAGALGDAGSPASDSTLGPTSGLNADGQHDHIRDSVVPTFLHFNIPLLIFGWVAAMVL